MPQAASDIPENLRSRGTRFAAWLDQPISGIYCVCGWILATTLYVALVNLFGGLSQLDTYESVYSTWSIAHGQFACAFPHGIKDDCTALSDVFRGSCCD